MNCHHVLVKCCTMQMYWCRSKQVTQLSQRDCAAGWGLEAKYTVHLRFIGKPIVDFLLLINDN